MKKLSPWIGIHRSTAAVLLLSFVAATGAAYAQSSIPNAPAPSTPSQSTTPKSPAQITGTTIDPTPGPQSPTGQQPPTATTPATPEQTASPSAPVPNQSGVSGAPAQTAPNNTEPAQRKPMPVPNPPAQTQGQSQNQMQNQQPPAGAAAAERGVTRGGVASRPAGVAIAPAKQHQMRSLLIKTGAIIAGAVAIGTIYALHRSTSSYPPGSGH
jgi:hypothetical protein